MEFWSLETSALFSDYESLFVLLYLLALPISLSVVILFLSFHLLFKLKSKRPYLCYMCICHSLLYVLFFILCYYHIGFWDSWGYIFQSVDIIYLENFDMDLIYISIYGLCSMYWVTSVFSLLWTEFITTFLATQQTVLLDFLKITFVNFIWCSKINIWPLNPTN